MSPEMRTGTKKGLRRTTTLNRQNFSILNQKLCSTSKKEMERKAPEIQESFPQD